MATAKKKTDSKHTPKPEASKKPASDRQKRKTPSSGKHEAARASDDDFVPADDPAAELIDQAVKQTPWWMMSVAFHGLALAVLPLIIVTKNYISEHQVPGVIIVTKPQKVAPITDADLDLRRTAVAHAGELPTKDSSTDDSLPPPVIDPSAIVGDRDLGPGPIPDDPKLEGCPGSPDGTTLIETSGTDMTGRRPDVSGGRNESIGVGGGSGSGKRFGDGGRWGSRTRMLKERRGKNPTKTDSAVEAGLRWLARHQSDDGAWHAGAFRSRCKQGSGCSGEGLSDFDTGLTGLSLLAFLGAGYTPQFRAVTIDPATGDRLFYGEVIRKGLRWLMDHQTPEGAIGPQVGEMMYNHSIAALALTEAYGLTNAFAYRAPAQKAINFIHVAQNYNLGWRYTPKSGQNDTSVTGWCVMALKSAQISGLEVAKTSFEGARAWIDRVTDRNTGLVGYDRLNSGEIYVPGKNEAWQHHPSMTAVGMLSRIFIDKQKDKVLADGAKILMQDLPKWDPKAQRPTVDFYYWYYATLALYQLDGPEGSNWTRWNKAVSSALCDNQKRHKDGCADGSWEVDACDRWAYAGGRVYGTAINVLTLEASYRYESVFGGARK